MLVLASDVGGCVLLSHGKFETRNKIVDPQLLKHLGHIGDLN